MKSHYGLAGIALALLWTLAGAQTSMTADSKDAVPDPQGQRATTRSATEPQPDANARLPVNKVEDTKQSSTATAGQPTDKMSGKTSGKKTHVAQHHKHGSHAKSTKSTKTSHHTVKTKAAHRTNPPGQALTKEEKDYQAALRQCVSEKDLGARDSCLDGAIERFHRNG
jgi:cell division protein FtsN